MVHDLVLGDLQYCFHVDMLLSLFNTHESELLIASFLFLVVLSCKNAIA